MKKILLLSFVILLGNNCHAMVNRPVYQSGVALAERVEQFAADVKILEQQLAESQSKLQTANNTVDAHKAELADYERRLKKQNDELENYKKQLGEREAELSDCKQKIEDQQAALGDFVEREQNLRGEVDRLTKSNKAKDYSIGALKTTRNGEADAFSSSEVKVSKEVAPNIGKRGKTKRNSRNGR